jgi:hypothetical protein
MIGKETGSLPKCKHGYRRDDGRYDGSWYAPFDECKCCGVSYPYVDSGYYTFSKDGLGSSGGRSWTKGLCAGCGGHYEAWGTSR